MPTSTPDIKTKRFNHLVYEVPIPQYNDATKMSAFQTKADKIEGVTSLMNARIGVTAKMTQTAPWAATQTGQHTIAS